MNDGTIVEIYMLCSNMSDVAVKMLKKYIALKRYFLWFFCIFCIFYYPM